MEITLPPEVEELVIAQIGSGQYQSPGEVVAAGVRLLSERELERRRAFDELRQEVARGIEQADRGELAPLDMAAIKADGRRRLAEQGREA